MRHVTVTRRGTTRAMERLAGEFAAKGGTIKTVKLIVFPMTTTEMDTTNVKKARERRCAGRDGFLRVVQFIAYQEMTVTRDTRATIVGVKPV